MRICIVIAPFANPEDAKARITNFLHLISPLAQKIYIVTGNFPYKLSTDNCNNVCIINVKYNPKKRPIIIRIFRHLILQIKISLHLFNLATRSDIFLFWLSGTFALPMLVCKLFGKKVILFVTGSWSESAKISFGKSLLSNILYPIVRLMEKLTYIFAAQIILVSNSMRDQVASIAGSSYLNKCVVTPARFIDTKIFRNFRGVHQRQNIVGFVGRLSEEKGVTNLIEALKDESLRYLKLVIIGSGHLLGDLTRMVNQSNLQDRVVFKGWLSTEDVARWLNEIKLLVLPSYSEGLGMCVLEAMACGTPVLSTPVSQEVIRDGKTGFIMENNSPECIAKNIKRALDRPADLKKISRNAEHIVKKKYSYEAIVRKYKKIFENISYLKSFDR